MFSFATFYSKEIFSALDQVISDGKGYCSRITVKIKPFTLLLPPWGSVSEELAKELDHLSIGKASSGSPVTEPGVLREDFLGKKLAKTCLSAELQTLCLIESTYISLATWHTILCIGVTDNPQTGQDPQQQQHRQQQQHWAWETGATWRSRQLLENFEMSTNSQPLSTARLTRGENFVFDRKHVSMYFIQLTP